MNAEHEKNKPVPERRAIQLLRDQLKGTQQSHFFTGNRATSPLTPGSPGKR